MNTLSRKGSNLPKVSDKAEIAVRVVGATLNEDFRTLFKLYKQYKADDEISFLLLSGIFQLMGRKDTSFDDTFDFDIMDEFYYHQQSAINMFLNDFEKILNKRDYENYNVALMPGAKVNKSQFLEQSFLGIFDKLCSKLFSGNLNSYEGGDVFMVSENVKLMIIIFFGYKVVTENFGNQLKKVILETLDNAYVNSFSNSKTKVWDARRAALEYWVKQLFVFNDSFTKEYQKSILRRWKAWFLLEDKYKRENLKVVRKDIKQQMLKIWNDSTLF